MNGTSPFHTSPFLSDRTRTHAAPTALGGHCGMFDSAECARPRAQQAPDVRMRPISMEGSFAFLHCCARGRAHSDNVAAPVVDPLPEATQCPAIVLTLPP